MDDAQTRAIDEFVKNGGGLVATLDASLFDEFGTPRSNFALADAFGVNYRGLISTDPSKADDLDVNFAKSIGPDYWEKRKNVFEFKQDTSSILNQGKMKLYVGDDSVTFKGPAVRVATKDASAKLLGTIRAKGVSAPVDYPAIISRTHGKGRVVYFATGFDAAYYLYSYPYQRLALKHAVEWAANSTPPVRVEAPMCVHTTVMRQTKDNAERLVVHLFNDANTTSNHAMPNEDVPLREESLPIHNIRVNFGPGYKLGRVHLEPEGKNLELKPSPDGGSYVIVPQLDIHAMVVGELIK
jgi:hypothetical protein